MNPSIPQIQVQHTHKTPLPTITPIPQAAKQANKPSLMALAGSTRGLYGKNTQEIQEYIINERNSWER